MRPLSRGNRAPGPSVDRGWRDGLRLTRAAARLAGVRAVKTNLHMPRFHPHAIADHAHKSPLSTRLGRAEGGFDYIAVGLVVLLGGAMAIGLLTAAG